MRLLLPYGIESVGGHIFDTIQRFLDPINTLCLHSVNGVLGFDVLHYLIKIDDAATQTVGDENRRFLRARLQLDQTRDGRDDRLLQQRRKSGDGGRVVDHHGREFASAGKSDFVEELESER